MSLRTDKASGIITGVFGIALIVFASCGLMMVALQRLMISTMPAMSENPNATGPSPIDAMRAVHGVWSVYLPIIILGGVVFAVSGFYIRRGSLVARRIAQVNALCGYVWIVAYTLSCIQFQDLFMSLPVALPDAVKSVARWLTMGFSMLMMVPFPTGVLFVLSRPRRRRDASE